jgi:hypothetical protein
MGQGDIPTAIDIFSKVVRAAPLAHSALANLGVCYHILGQNEVAIDWFKVRRLRLSTRRRVRLCLFWGCGWEWRGL